MRSTRTRWVGSAGWRGRVVRGLAAATLSLAAVACGPPRVALVPARTCDGGNLEDCEQRCGQNEHRACYRLGWFKEEGQGVEANLEEAMDLYERACDASYAVACRALAIIYERGDIDVEKDTDKAEEYYAKACGLGLESACPVQVFEKPKPKGDAFAGAGDAAGELGIKGPEAPKAPEAPEAPRAPEVNTPQPPSLQAPQPQAPQIPTVPTPGG